MRRLKIEIIPNKSENETRVLIWDGMRVVDNTVMEEVVESTTENRETILKKYLASLQKENND